MSILREVFDAVAAWRGVGRRLRFKAATLEAYTSTFENACMTEARAGLGIN